MPVELCGANRQGKKPCGLRAGFGTDHVGVGRCKLHGGATPTHQRAAQREIARRECVSLGIPVEVDPGEALIRALWEASGNVEFYRAKVASMGIDLLATEHGPAGASKEVPSPWVLLYNEERAMLRVIAVAAIKAGVEERRVRMAEADARELFAAVAGALEAAGLDTLQANMFRRELAERLRIPAVLPELTEVT